MRQLTIFDEDEITGIEDDAPDTLRNAWRAAKKQMKQNFKELQEMPYEAKLKRQESVAKEFYEEMQKRECGCHVSVGDWTALHFLYG